MYKTFRCLNWICDKNSSELCRTRTAVVQNVVCRFKNVKVFNEFLVAMVMGFGPCVSSEYRRDFIQTVLFEDMKLPDRENPENVYYDAKTNSLACYPSSFLETSSPDPNGIYGPQLVQTPSTQSYINSVSLVLVGVLLDFRTL